MKTQAANNEFLQSRVAHNLSATTILWYKQRLEPFATFCPELPKEPGPIDAFLATRQGEPETVHASFRALRALFRFRTERYDLPNPMDKVKPPRCPKKVMPTLEPNEMMWLLSSATGLRERTLLTLLIDTGMRSSEAAGLRKQNIKTHTVRVCGKSGERELAISDEARRLLLMLISQDGEDEYVFHGHKGPLTRHGVYRIVRAHMERAGIAGPKLGGHRVRHAFGKGWMVNGGDLYSLGQQMGHENISTTQKYASLNMNDTIAKHHKFTPLRSTHAAAQESLFDTSQAIKEAETILTEARKEDRP